MKRVCLVLLALSLTGCADLPVVGNVGQALGPLKDAIRPILKMIPGMGGDEEAGAPASKVDESEVRRQAAKRRRQQREGQSSEAQSGPGLNPAAAPAQEARAQANEQFVIRNMEFDSYRTRGLMALYSRSGDSSRVALDHFQKALVIKPGDGSVERLIDMVRHPEKYQSSLESNSPSGASFESDPTAVEAPGGG